MRGCLHDGRVSKKDDQMALLAGRVRGQTVRGLVIGLIYPHSPRVSSSSAPPAPSQPVCSAVCGAEDGVYGVCAPS